MSTSNRIKGKNAVPVFITFGIISPSVVIAATLILANINSRPTITKRAIVSGIAARGLNMGGAVIVTIGVAIVIILTELFGKGGKH